MRDHFDPWESMIHNAQERVLQAGIQGGDLHEEVDQATIMMAVMGWAVTEIKASNRELVEVVVANGNGNGNGRKGLVRKHGPGAGVGAVAVTIIQAIREFLM